MSALAFNIKSVKAPTEMIYVDDDNTTGPWNGTKENPYQNITNALEHASDNDTIYVYSGTYYEHVLVNKSVSIIGENKTTTILDGSGENHTIINIIKPHVTVARFTVQNTASYEPPAGISVRANWSTIQDNIVKESFYGIDLDGSNHSRICNNNIVYNHFYGVLLRRKSNNNTIIDNWIINNPTGITVVGIQNTIRHNIIKESNIGLLLEGSIHSQIQNNKISNSSYGISLEKASNNTFVGNAIVNNSNTGIYCFDDISQYNTFYRNNIVNNENQIRFFFFNCSWDNGVEGNYWSGYDGNDSDCDGIGDSWYEIGVTDHYPLMGIFSSFNTSVGKHINVISNSTIESFQYFESNSTIKMYVSNMMNGQTHGFCRICILHELMNVTSISVIIDHEETAVLHPNYNLYDNGTHRWIYFAYEHSTHEIDIIPEFPLIMIAPLFIAGTTLAVMFLRKKRHGICKSHPCQRIRRNTHLC